MKKSQARKQKLDTSLKAVPDKRFLYKMLSDNKARYIQELRRVFRESDSRAIFGKYRMLEKVLEEKVGRESMDVLKSLAPFKGTEKIYYYLFSDMGPAKVSEMVGAVEHLDYEKAGHPLVDDVVLRQGEVLTAESTKISNTLYKNLRQWGLGQAVVNPKTNNIEVESEVVLGRQGHIIDENTEQIMRALGIKRRRYETQILGRVEMDAPIQSGRMSE
jgi:ribosomal protein L10